MKHHCYSFLFWSFKSGHGIPYLEYSMKSPTWPTLMTTSQQLFVLFMAVGGVVRAGKKGWKESLRRCSLMILLLEILWERPSSKIIEGQQQNILFKYAFNPDPDKTFDEWFLVKTFGWSKIMSTFWDPGAAFKAHSFSQLQWFFCCTKTSPSQCLTIRKATF